MRRPRRRPQSYASFRSPSQSVCSSPTVVEAITQCGTTGLVSTRNILSQRLSDQDRIDTAEMTRRGIPHLSIPSRYATSQGRSLTTVRITTHRTGATKRAPGNDRFPPLPALFLPGGSRSSRFQAITLVLTRGHRGTEMHVDTGDYSAAVLHSSAILENSLLTALILLCRTHFRCPGL